jgi:hypothetical protein
MATFIGRRRAEDTAHFHSAWVRVVRMAYCSENRSVSA